MMPSGQKAIEAIERLRKSQEELNRIIMEIAQPVDLDNLPNPYGCESELLPDGSDDGSGLEPHRR